ncbi:hypothetical protein HDV63DRAFT_415413 [Trichoderma sp. SZMC 28014]
MTVKLTKEDFKWSSGPAWRGQRRHFFLTVGISFLAVQLVFLLVMSVVYGSQYEIGQKVHRFDILTVDYDHGLIGESLFAAYDQLKSGSFPTLQVHPVSEYPTEESLKDAVHAGEYWGAIYTIPGASDRLNTALRGGQAATNYNNTDTIRYIWNGARFPLQSAGYIEPNLEALIAGSRLAYYQLNGTGALAALNSADTNALKVFVNPIATSSINIKPTNQGARVFYNTASVAVHAVQQFFFIMAINSASQKFQIFSRLSIRTNGTIRDLYCAISSLFGALCWAGYIFAFQEDWGLSGGQFALIWMIGWLYQFITIKLMDVVTAFFPFAFAPFVIITWALFNIASALTCYPLAPRFYKLMYALPGRNYYETFVTITSGGAVDQLYRNLPVLFAWALLLQALAVPANIHRYKVAKELGKDEERIE